MVQVLLDIECNVLFLFDIVTRMAVNGIVYHIKYAVEISLIPLHQY